MVDRGVCKGDFSKATVRHPVKQFKKPDLVIRQQVIENLRKHGLRVNLQGDAKTEDILLAIQRRTGWESSSRKLGSSVISRYWSRYCRAKHTNRRQQVAVTPPPEAPEVPVKFNIYQFSKRPDFYDTIEWKRVRYERLRIDGRRCKCCGRSGGALDKITGRVVIIHVDHIKSKSLYPELCLTLGNTQCLCDDCNLGKGARDAGRCDTVFSLSLGDVWDNEVDPEWRRDLFRLMIATPHLIWLLLSKRVGNAVKMAEAAGGLPDNAALGSTMVNQEEWDRDGYKLFEASQMLAPMFTFASVEPMLGNIQMGDWCPDWVICGGESGAGARDMPSQWAWNLKTQVQMRKKAFFLKQMSRKAPIPDDIFIRQFPPQMAA